MVSVPIQMIAAFFCSMGFSVLFNLHGKQLWYSAFGSMISWGLYRLLGTWTSDVVAYFFVGMAVMLYAEILARLIKNPTTSFLVPVIIPLIPGGALYYAMQAGLTGESTEFIEFGTHALALAAALAVGLFMSASICKMIYTIIQDSDKGE
jgi:uncharacterized membrane protein YjjB (DUF3815 family)